MPKNILNLKFPNMVTLSKMMFTIIDNNSKKLKNSKKRI